MNRITSLCAFLLASLALTSAGASTFKYLNGDDTAVNGDWSLTQSGVTYGPVYQGSPTKPFVVTSDSFAGAAALGYQTPTDLSGSKERIEHYLCLYNDPAGVNFTNARYIGYAVKLVDAGGGFLSSVIFTQGWQGSPWGPPVMLKITGGSASPYPLRLNIRNMTTGPDSTTPDLNIWSGSLSSGIWHTVVLYIKPRLDNSGEVTLWLDGVQKVDWIGQLGYDPAQVSGALNGLDCKYGIYQVSTNNTKTFYFDEVRYGDTYASVDPVGLHAATPTFSPAGGIYASAQSVTIATATAGAAIRYTTDGSTPSATNGALYTGPVTVASSTTLKAVAIASGMADSAVASATYTISNLVNLGDIADSFTASSTPTTNNGSNSVLATKTGSPTRYAFLKFDTSALPADAIVDSATLTLNGFLNTSDPLPSVSVACYSITDNSWTESGITWNNMPAMIAALSSTNVARGASANYTWDVTSFVASQRTAGTNLVSLGIKDNTTSTQNCNFNSKEATSNRPKLTIAYHQVPPAPSAPTNLTAAGGNAEVTLNWNASAGAATYGVKQATVSGGPYSVVASDVTSTSYVDDSVTNGTTYYYVVSAVNAGGESADSNEASATPASPPAVITSPSDQTVPIGGSAEFKVVAAGTAPLSYQWSKDGVAIPGATAATLTLSNLALSDAGAYAVTIRNSVGTVTASAQLKVVDVTPPVLSLPADIVVEATGPSGAVVTFSATANDNVDGAVAVQLTPPSGSLFPLGNTTVNASAHDAAGNVATGSFTVTVRDTTPPTLTVPPNLVLEATSPAGAVANFAATATDVVTLSPSITYSIAPGTTFPLGITTVNVTATDAAGNQSTGFFTVTVRDTTPPTLTALSASPNSLWPPNKKMVPVAVTATAFDAVGVVSLKVVSVASNEPDGNVQWQVTGPLTLNLLADRLGGGIGRVYTITVEATDAAGNATHQTVTVTVPHDQGR